MKQHCPVCATICVPAVGHSDLLIVGEFPGREEISQGRPFASNSNYMTAGRILRKELERCGVSLNDFMVCNLWLHEPNKDERCFQVGYEQVLEHAKGKSAVLLVGSDTVSTFTGYKVSDVAGLEVDSSILSSPIIYAMPNPALAEHRALGEVRLSIEKFVKRLEQEKLL